MIAVCRITCSVRYWMSIIRPIQSVSVERPFTLDSVGCPFVFDALINADMISQYCLQEEVGVTRGGAKQLVATLCCVRELSRFRVILSGQESGRSSRLSLNPRVVVNARNKTAGPQASGCRVARQNGERNRAGIARDWYGLLDHRIRARTA
mgnify:FL=1